MKKFTLLLLIVACNLFAQAQFDYSLACQQAHSNVLKLNFDSVSVINISNNSRCWIEAYSAFASQMANPKKDEAQDAIQQVAANISALQTSNDESADAKLALADLWLMKSVLYFKNADYVSATTAYFKSIRYVDYTQPLALKHSLARIAVERLMLNLMPYSNKNGNAQSFAQHCQLVAAFVSDSTIAQPFKVELSWLFFTVVNDANVDAQHVANVFETIPPDWFGQYPLLTLSGYKVAVKYGFTNHAQKLMQCILRNQMDKKVASANMIIGNYWLANASDSCMRYFDACKSSAPMYVAMKKSWLHFIQARTDSADKYVGEVLAQQPQTDADKQAQYECSLHQHWHPQLMKARVLFDVADYEQAKIQLDLVDVGTLNNSQTAEYNYRMARVQSMLGNVDEAKQYFRKVVESGTDAELYYPAYSAYYLALMFANEGKTAQCKYYVDVCLRLNSPIYCESIRNKARNIVVRN